MKKMVNFHTHTQRCMHALGTEEDYIKKAVSLGLSHLGFSDHGPFPDFDYSYRMKYSELDDYINVLRKLQKKYISRIRISIGLEIEYLPKYYDYYKSLLSKRGIDYLILGQHFYQNSKGKITENNNNDQELVYSIDEALNTSFFCIVAHPDYLLSTNPSQNVCQQLLSSVIKNNTVLEYNASRYRNDSIWKPQNNTLWQMAEKNNAKVIVGSDAHSPNQLWDDAVKRSYSFLQQMNINPVFSPF